ncbi:3-hydroxyacyl-ACP dehydratase FabZ family protein [Maribacter cobaltidurans]|uniref:Hydroxymyristoyl-ACP dehydratase n=1 Tax=Maribacter cobaltidurans TaxID=1178778 RepID=A0A223V9U1_9FLAO|nr:3-hydroxyacyl-ACP dehydratase FabZ family protein [Maribacter cobaltidurans]ASV32072.1 hydroxymyristoyl-ACP dehydratase [Maribacter cobaltidurans]GGD87016.1 beta-hydroxyacyl-ACP dehydratase [Maribacter cobaltidurans]
MDNKEILALLPYDKPFLFVDNLQEINNEGAKGSFHFKEQLDFYKGHFKDNPVTPGVILTECCAQIGLVCLGIYLIGDEDLDSSKILIGMSSSEMEFLQPVYPGETVTVRSRKIYYRFHKLKCEVKMYNEENDMVCKGTLSGMLKGVKK